MTQAVDTPGVADDEIDDVFGVDDGPAVLADPPAASPEVVETARVVLADGTVPEPDADGLVTLPASASQGSVGGWVLKVTPKHTCIKPEIDARTFVGSIWQCGECEEFYIVAEKRGKDAGTKVFRKITAEKAKEKLATMS